MPEETIEDLIISTSGSDESIEDLIIESTNDVEEQLEPGQGVLTPEAFDQGKLSPAAETTAPAAGERVVVTASESEDGGLEPRNIEKELTRNFEELQEVKNLLAQKDLPEGLRNILTSEKKLLEQEELVLISEQQEPVEDIQEDMVATVVGDSEKITDIYKTPALQKQALEADQQAAKEREEAKASYNLEKQKQKEALEAIDPLWKQADFESPTEYYEYLNDAVQEEDMEWLKYLKGHIWAADKLGGLSETVVNIAKGGKNFYDMAFQSVEDLRMNLMGASDEERKVYMKEMRDVAAIMDEPFEDAIDFTKEFQYDSEYETIIDAIEASDWTEAADMTIKGVFSSLPYLALSATGVGGIVAIGATTTGGKYDELIESDPDEAMTTIMLNAGLTGLQEAALEVVSYGIIKRARGLIGRGDKEAADALINAYGKQMAKRLGADATKEGVTEAIQEFNNDLIDYATLSEAQERQVSFSDVINKNWKKWGSSGIVGFASGGMVNAAGALNSDRVSVRNAAETALTPDSDLRTIRDAAIDINSLNDQLKETTDKDQKAQLQVEMFKKEVEIIGVKQKVTQQLNNMTKDELKTYAKNKSNINQKRKWMKSAPSIFIRESSAQDLENLERENEALIRESVNRRIAENAKKGEKTGAQVGANVNTLNNANSYQKAYNNTEQGKKESINVKGSDGFIDPNTGDIFINKEVAEKVRNVNTAGHEILHAILNNSFKEPGQLNNVVKEFKSVLPKDIAEQIQQRIDAKYRFKTFESESQASKIYSPTEIKNTVQNDDGSITVELVEDTYNEEYLTAFADIVQNNKVVYKENQNVFTQLGDFLKPIFRKKGYGTIKFNTGQDVYDFIESYQKQITKGELDPATVKAAKEGVGGKLVTETKTESKPKEKVAFSETEIEGISPKQVQTMVDKVANRAWSKFGKPIPANIKQKAGVTRQSYIESAKTELAGIAKEFDPNKKDKDGNPIEFNRFMANRGMQRMNSLASRLGVESADKPATQRIGETVREGEREFDVASTDLTPEEAVISKEDDTKVRKGIKLTERLGEDAKKISEKVKKMKPVLEGKTYKTLKDLAPDDTQRMFGIAPKTGNLTKEDVRNAQAFIRKNVDVLLAMLPEGTTISGKATGVQKVLLDPFYTKGRRVKAAKTGSTQGLATQNKKPNIKISEFLEVFGITPAGQPNVSDRNTSSRIKALVDQTGKLLTNQAIREVTPDAPKEIAEGKSRVMFSEENIGDLKEVASYTLNVDKSKKPLFRPKNIKRTRGEKFKDWVEGLVYVNPKDIGKSYSTRDLSQKLPDDIALFEGETVKDGIVRITNEFIKENPEFYQAIKDSTTIGVERGLLSTKVIFDQLIDPVRGVEQKGKRYPYTEKGGLAKKSFVESTKNKDYVKNQLKQVDNFRNFFEKIESHLKNNPNDAWYFDALVKDAQNNQNSIFRYSSPVLFMSVDKNGKIVLNEQLREEHSSPQNNIGTMLLDAAINGYVKDVKPLIKAMLMQGGLTRVDDTKLDVDFKSTMPDFFWDEVAPKILSGKVKLDPGIAAVIRMTEAGVNLDNYKYFPADKSFSEYLFGSKGLSLEYQADLTRKYLSEEITLQESRSRGKALAKELNKISKGKQKALVKDKQVLEQSKVIKLSEDMSMEDVLNKAASLDEALRNARNPKAPVKKIRVFDFDDTLARTKSKVYYTKPNITGKPSPKRKAIFMIGGPGSGKTNVGKGLQLGREGFKVVNQDIFVESEKAKQGLPESERDYTPEQKSARAKIGAAGVRAAKAKLKKYTEAGEGMVIDGTGASYNATMKKVKDLENQGYEVHMVHAKTSPEAAKERNRNRKERRLPTWIVSKTQKSVEKNVEQYKKDFGDRFMEIDTETIEYGKPLPKDFVAEVKTKVYENEVGTLNAEEFAEQGDLILEEGGEFDFSEFNRVVDGEPGPLLDIAKKIQEARGTDDVFVLTARSQEASPAIKKFLDAVGLKIPAQNISGLGDSSPFAKSNWIVDKAAEGYNDFYFADDHMANVKAVRDALEVLDVKSKTQQAKIKFSEDMSMDFNTILEESKGIDKFKIFSDVKAQVRGARKGRGKFFIPPSAEDFQGLLYSTLGKGKQGERHLQFYDKALFKPYAHAMENLSTDRINLMADFKALKKDLDVPKDLRKTTESGFTNEQAVRVYLWNKTNQEIPGISKTDLKELTDIIENDPKLKVFADQILSITKGDGYSKPGKNWTGGTITTDLIEILNTTKRTKYLQTWQENVDIIFSKDNMNKLEAIFGPKYVEALRNSLTRMKAGRNRVEGGNRLSNRVLDYINNSTGAIMFFNMRSALLQTISAANFINWSFNNPYKAGKAFANQPQYWKDFAKLMNSEYLVDRRNGLKLNINESEIADAAKTSKNKAKAIVSYIIEKGYIPTKFADSFAIATGGATFYRNKIKDLMKNEGLTEAVAEKIAMQEFRRVSEISQQSSDPSKISQQQSTDLGRVVLQFVNTPMQYARIQKRAAQDIINRRGDDKTNVSKIVYYAFLQNMIFNALQSGLFAIGFGDDDDLSENDEKKIFRTANGMMDSWLRGLGMAGVTVQVLKNLGIDIYDRSKKDRPEYTDAWQTLLQFSPAIKSKLSKFKSAAYPFDSKKRRAEVFDKGFSLDNPAYESAAKVITATTNIPLDRVFTKVNNIKGALDEDTEAWQSTAMILGWPEWQIKDDSKSSSSKSKSTKKSSNKKRVKRKIRKKR